MEALFTSLFDICACGVGQGPTVWRKAKDTQMLEFYKQVWYELVDSAVLPLLHTGAGAAIIAGHVSVQSPDLFARALRTPAVNWFSATPMQMQCACHATCCRVCSGRATRQSHSRLQIQTM